MRVFSQYFNGFEDVIMKKIITIVAAAALCLSCLVSCGGPKALADYTLAETEQYVTLGNYAGVSVSQAEIDSTVQSQLDSVLSASATSEAKNGAAEDGDTVTYSCTGTVGGAAADALTMTDKTFTVGTDTTSIEALDAAFAGMSAGDTKELSVTIPANYAGDETVDGKDAVLNLTVSEVSETVIPETLTDDMVSTYTDGTYATIAAYKEALAKTVKENLAFSAALQTCTFKGYPADLAETYYNNSLASYKAAAQNYNVTLDVYASAMGVDLDTLTSYLAQQAIAQAKQDITLCAIALKEGLEPTDADVEKTENEMMEMYGFTSKDELYAAIKKDLLKQSAKHQMVVEMIADKAVVTD